MAALETVEVCWAVVAVAMAVVETAAAPATVTMASAMDAAALVGRAPLAEAAASPDSVGSAAPVRRGVARLGVAGLPEATVACQVVAVERAEAAVEAGVEATFPREP